MKKIIEDIILILVLAVWIMPVSNQINIINNSMIRICYIFNIFMLLIVIFYESKLYIKQLIITVSILLLLGACTLLTYFYNTDNPIIAYGYLFNYLPFCLMVNAVPDKLSRSSLLDRLFDVICFILIVVGVLIVVRNLWIGDFLKTYYTNHYPWLYPEMLDSRKTVTFFATHNMACYYYFILWLLADYRFKIKKDKMSLVIITGMIFLIVMCKSTSMILCVGIIMSVYFIRWTRRGTINSTTIVVVALFLMLFVIIYRWDFIWQILGSKTNGLSGRFGADGNLIPTLKYMLGQLPLGICDINNLWVTDGGIFVNFIRGGILLVVMYYWAFYRFISLNIYDNKCRNMIFYSFLLFEVGYQTTMSMRSFMIILFAIIYFKHLQGAIPNG